MQQNILIVIPARYNSSRLPGKPLLMIAGKTMLQRVCETAQLAAQQFGGKILVATDDNRILQHAQQLGVDALLTDSACSTGTDRVISAIKLLPVKPSIIINLQGDAPLTPATVITELLNTILNINSSCIATPVVQLTWNELDSLRNTKINNPFSGTTVIMNNKQEAIWFSKQIIPGIRNESQLRNMQQLSPIYQHLGIYAYTLDMLETFADLPLGNYEQLEGLEQLRLLENSFKIQAVPVTLPNLNAWRGVDTLDDAKLVAQLLGE